MTSRARVGGVVVSGVAAKVARWTWFTRALGFLVLVFTLGTFCAKFILCFRSEQYNEDIDIFGILVNIYRY